MSLKLYRPTPEGGMEPAPVEAKDYRTRLRSRRWNAAPLANPDTPKTNPWIAVAAITGVAALTFVVLVVGYLIRLW
jgi:hypothetical protein